MKAMSFVSCIVIFPMDKLLFCKRLVFIGGFPLSEIDSPETSFCFYMVFHHIKTEGGFLFHGRKRRAGLPDVISLLKRPKRNSSTSGDFLSVHPIKSIKKGKIVAFVQKNIV